MQHPQGEDRYHHVGKWRTYEHFTDRERLAIEFAEKFALEHHKIDDAFFERLRAQFADDEILDLMVCIASFLALGRVTKLLGVEPDQPIVLDDPESASG